MIAFIDNHRDRFWVKPTCRVLTEHKVTIGSSCYYTFENRPAAVPTLSDEELIVDIERVFWNRDPGRGISGARKMRRLVHRQGIVVARCTVECLMRRQGLRGIGRGEQFITTRPDERATRSPNHVNRDFTACRPNQLWVADFTSSPTWSGMAVTAFVTDVFSRRINVVGVTHHSDAGRQHTAVRYADRLAEVGAIVSIGMVGNSYDNALAASVIRLCKTERAKISGPFRTDDELELATLSWLHWFNENRLRSSIGHLIQIKKENTYDGEINARQRQRPRPLPGELFLR